MSEKKWVPSKPNQVPAKAREKQKNHESLREIYSPSTRVSFSMFDFCEEFCTQMVSRCVIAFLGVADHPAKVAVVNLPLLSRFVHEETPNSVISDIEFL